MDCMWGLATTKGGISPLAARSLYTGMVRPIFTWAAEIWRKPNTRNTHLREMGRIEYKALRRICSGYYGSRHTTLTRIAAVEPLESKLDDISASWAGRAVRNGDPNMRAILKSTRQGDKWHEGHRMYAHGPHSDGLHNPISRSFRATIAEPGELSFRDCDDTGNTALTDQQLIQREDPRSEYEALWLTMLGEKMDEGWRLAYSDGCGRANHNSFACHREG